MLSLARTAVFLCFVMTLVVPARADQPQILDEVAWLLGSWEQRGDRSTLQETWRKLHAEAFQGTGVTIRASSGEVRSKESMLLTLMSGEVFYFAKVDQHTLPIAFRLVDSSTNHAVFENKDHDFPKRLEYKRQSKDALEVRVSDAAEKEFTIRFRRMSK